MRVKAWGPLWALLGLIALASFGLFEYDIPNNQSRPTPTERQHQPSAHLSVQPSGAKNDAKRHENQDGYNIFGAKLTDILLVIFNGLLALFTFRLYLATSGLFKETAGLRTAADQQAVDMKAAIKAATDAAKAAVTSNQIAVTNAEQQLRAYVTVQEISVRTYRHPSTYPGTEFWRREELGEIHTYEFTPVLKNGGQTPAINVVSTVNAGEFAGGIADNFAFSDSGGTTSHGLIGPQTIWHAPTHSAAADIVNSSDKVPSLIWGSIEYDDIFTGTFRHRTEFCFQITLVHVPITGERIVYFIPYNRYNNMDGNCEADFDPHENKYH